MKAEILKALRENGGYCSGQELCDTFQVSRTAVWKAINQLREEGYVIEAVRNRGYHLAESGDILSKSSLESNMDTAFAGRKIVYLEETDSTNTRAKKLAEDGADHGTLVVADYQNAGKGRRGKGWCSPRGTGLWMSLIVKPEIEPFCASMLTLIAAVAVADGIKTVSGLDAKIKWPNDLVINGRKVCGILTEMSSEPDRINYVVIGIGINGNQKEFPEEIKEMATSLLLEGGEEVSRAMLAGAVMASFEGYYETFLKTKDLSLLRQKYQEHLVNCGREVKVVSADGGYTGTAVGITDTGELVIELPDGTLRQVMSGEVSVRGLYGYV